MLYKTLIVDKAIKATLNTNIVLAIAVAGVVVALTLAPLATSQAFAKSLTTCTGGPPGCQGNSGSNGNCNDGKGEEIHAGNSENSKVKATTC